MIRTCQVSILLCLLFVALSSGSPVARGASSAAVAADDAPATVYTSKCAACHGADGKGSPVGKSLKAPDLTSKEVQAETDDTLKHVISAGKGNMPAFGQSLSDDTVTGLVKYVRTLPTK